ncbi:alpha-(1,6)-fucosyltransferase-like [Penaeus japonicus]|uniref:alpha-(1,6)-fucosyltransferase-like n=1 Tax=Penaeus japonicus TaxID=27405 RepID=UPI001C713E45|nr:alpha-(1,6)-fucosyltransferase-like [Penaeus japonicus]
MRIRWQKCLRIICCLPISLLIFAMVKKTSFIPVQKIRWEISRDSGTINEKEQDFTSSDASTPMEVSLIYEQAEKLYRQVESDVYHTKQHVFALLQQASNQIPNNVYQDIKHYFRVAEYDLWRFHNGSGLSAWQKREVEELSNLVQHRIHALQNPVDCKSAKKMLCDLPVNPRARGIGSQIHHLSYCFLAAYGTQRTLIVNRRQTPMMTLDLETYFLPLSENCNHATDNSTRWPGIKDNDILLK